MVRCRGKKFRGRYRGCLGTACEACAGIGEVEQVAGDVACKSVLNASGEVLERGCDGTGLNLSSARALPRTEKGGVATDRDTLMESGSDELSDYAENEHEKSRTTYVPYLRSGILAPLSITPNVLVSSTRCSYEGCPVHQFPRQGKERGCIRARGAWCGCDVEYVLGSTDYSAGELCALAQFCKWLFGRSHMLDAINASGDPGILHSELAAAVLRLPLAEFLRRLEARDEQAVFYRQASKPMNFGKPAGMGTPRIVTTNRKKSAGFTPCPGGPARNHKGTEGYWGIRFCVLVTGARRCGSSKIQEWKGRECPPVCAACCDAVENVLTPAYFARFPEIKEYYKWGSAKVEAGAPAPIAVWDDTARAPQILVERGGCDYSAFLNNGFQSLLAMIGKRSYADATRECLLGEKPDGAPSPLAGCRLPLFLHDEPLSELVLDTAHLSGPRIAEIMVATGRRLAPDVIWKAETALAFYWDKAMEPVYDSSGKLVPWEPRK
jgi:hypothetical protein